MKNKRNLLILAVLGLHATFTNAQINVTSGGNVSLGTVVAPPASTIGCYTYGSAMFTTNTTSSNYGWCPFINATNGTSSSNPSSATAPDYTWYGDQQTGIYHPQYQYINFTTASTQRLSITNGSGAWSQSIIGTVYNIDQITYAVDYNGSTNFYVEGNGLAVSSSGFYTSSDRTLKENIKPIDNALDKVLHLNGVTYNYIKPLHDAGDTKPQQIGLIAQDVEQIVPEVVTTDNKGIKAIAYQNLVGLLIEAIKEQDKKINDLQNAVNNCCTVNEVGFQGQNTNTTTGTNASPSTSTSQASLYQNVPNPFNQQTAIQYFVPTTSVSAAILVFNMEGVLLKTNTLNTFGNGSLIINGGDLKPGMYLYTLVVNNQEVDTKKMILTQ